MYKERQSLFFLPEEKEYREGRGDYEVVQR